MKSDLNLQCWDYASNRLKIGENVKMYYGVKLTNFIDSLRRLKTTSEYKAVINSRVLCKINPKTYEVERIYNITEAERILKLNQL